MNCQDFEKLARALARNRLLDATTREQGLVHTEVCERCAARLAEERTLLAGVCAVVADLAGEEAPARVEAALLAAFRAQTAAAASPNVVPLPGESRRWSSWKLAAVAAGILLVLSALLFRPANKPEHEARAVTPAPVNTPDSQIVPPKQTESPDEYVVARQPLKLRKRAPGRASINNAEEAAVATRFYSLVEDDALAPLESGRVVRVEVPAATLIPFGLSVTAEALTQPIQADLLLGQDGLARAIRFLPAGRTTKTQ